MSVLRITQFPAKEGQEEALAGFLASIVPEIARSAGCLSCEVVRGIDEPSKILLIERWESVEDHQSSTADIDPDQVSNISSALADQPTGEYFST